MRKRWLWAALPLIGAAFWAGWQRPAPVLALLIDVTHSDMCARPSAPAASGSDRSEPLGCGIDEGAGTQTLDPSAAQWPQPAGSPEFARWQDAQRSAFKARMPFPYLQSPTFSRAGSPIDRDGYAEEVWAVGSAGQRLFRYFKLRPVGWRAPGPTIVLFMGHGHVDQLLSDSSSYQSAAAMQLARDGYLVFVMENIAMTPGDSKAAHRRLDTVLGVAGYSWYSLLFAHQGMLLDRVFADPEVDPKHVAVAGVSTGGLLALSAAAMDTRVAAASVHGIFSSLNDSFGRDHDKHCSCGVIDGILPDFDLPLLALLVAPRALHVNNNANDTFPAADARSALERVRVAYGEAGSDVLEFTTPPGGHSFAMDEARSFLSRHLARPASASEAPWAVEPAASRRPDGGGS